MKVTFILFAFFMLACHVAQSHQTTENQAPIRKRIPAERQASNPSCEQGSPLKFVPFDGKTLLANPERGYYHHHHIKLLSHKPISQENIKKWAKEGITLALMIFDIEPFVKKDFTDEALKKMKLDFSTLRKAGMKGIVRFSYNQTNIKGNPDNHDFPKTTDAEKPQLLKHIKQLEKVFKENVDVINVVQLGLIGHWGEWYYSRNYATEVKKDGRKEGWKANEKQQKDRKDIVQAMMKAVPKNRMLQIRYPAAKQKIYGKANTKPDYDRSTEPSRLGIHNDCFLADETDTGTFADESERKWLEEEGLSVMVGGESCVKSPNTGCSNAKKQIEKQRFTYLNTDFNEDVIKDWVKNKCYNDIGNRMGYRFEFVGGKLQSTVKKGGSFCASLKIKNTGVAPLYNARPVEVILRNGNKKSGPIRQSSIDPRKFAPGKETTINLNVQVPSDIAPGKYEVILNLPDESLKDPKYSILFANGGKVQVEKERFNVIGQITIQ
ncbi:uncharacterized protein LOC130693596 [Daphnia carinata]|uniref:uncharacterized protein LOC130693596 n=1 Tax=Daphnia carinata TaxID=120202 RepID=UPI00257FF711|nr:uncharacterized protein LOC130693596 [Daphnia carinata]